MATTLHRAVILAVGSELTTGETRDTNGGDLAADLSRLGVHVVRVELLPDELDAAATAIRRAIDDADLVVSTGGLGPTPDDLTREAVAAALRLSPVVDPDLERQLVHLFERRGVRMPETNRKQAWLVPGAEALPNPHGTAPGWWLDHDGTLLVTLPGPPRELLPMWRERVLPRLRARGLGAEVAVRTLRLTGIGESYVAEALGEAMLRAGNPVVATYARPDAVDVRITARPEPGEDGGPGRSAAELEAEAERRVLAVLGRYVFARDDETWPEALGRRLGSRRVATWERGTGGLLAATLAGAPWFLHGEVVGGTDRAEAAGETGRANARAAVEALPAVTGTDVGLAVEASLRGGDTLVEIAVRVDGTIHTEQRTVFLAGEQGRRRAALAACAVLWEALAPDPVS